MTNKAAAMRYARALFDVALKERADLEQIDEQLGGVLELFRQHPALEKVLLNPAVPVPRKRAAVADLTGRLGLPAILAKLLVLLAERDRLVLVPDLLTAYRDRLMEHQRVVRAEVTTAVPLSPERVQLIERRLAEVTGKRVNLSTRTDPAIIGGLVARVGSTVYDGSVVKQLAKMRNRLAEGALSGEA